MTGEYPPATERDRREMILASMLDAAAARRRRRRALQAGLMTIPLLLVAATAALVLSRPHRVLAPIPDQHVADVGSIPIPSPGESATQTVSWQQATDPRQAAAAIMERPLTDDELLELLQANDVEMGLVRINGESRLVPWNTASEIHHEDPNPESGEGQPDATEDSAS